MTIKIDQIEDAVTKSSLLAKFTNELPTWFGRPEANAHYVRGVVDRDVFAAVVDRQQCGLIALEYHFEITCNIWWMGVSPAVHRRGIGRALIERAAQEALKHGCRQLAVETMSPRADSPEYGLTRRFYEAVGFVPFVEFEPHPGDYFMWMLREL